MLMSSSMCHMCAHAIPSPPEGVAPPPPPLPFCWMTQCVRLHGFMCTLRCCSAHDFALFLFFSMTKGGCLAHPADQQPSLEEEQERVCQAAAEPAEAGPLGEALQCRPSLRALADAACQPHICFQSPKDILHQEYSQVLPLVCFACQNRYSVLSCLSKSSDSFCLSRCRLFCWTRMSDTAAAAAAAAAIKTISPADLCWFGFRDHQQFFTTALAL